MGRARCHRGREPHCDLAPSVILAAALAKGGHGRGKKRNAAKEAFDPAWLAQCLSSLRRGRKRQEQSVADTMCQRMARSCLPGTLVNCLPWVLPLVPGRQLSSWTSFALRSLSSRPPLNSLEQQTTQHSRGRDETSQSAHSTPCAVPMRLPTRGSLTGS